MASDQTVKVPGIGPEKKSTVLLFGAAAVAVIIFAIMQKRKQAAAAAAAAAATGSGTASSGQFTDPGGNVCAAPNPQTGYCPGTPQDISASQQLAAGSSAYGLNSAYGGVSSLAGGGSTANNSVPVFVTNGAWAQYVEQMLGSDGTDAVAAAIAKYLSGQGVTSGQQTTIEQAIAVANYPPVAGPSGFPPSINLNATSTAPAPAPAPSPSPGVKAGAISNLQAYNITSTGFLVSWNPDSDNTQGYSYALMPSSSWPAGPATHSGSTTQTSVTFTGLAPGTSYNFGVQGLPGGPGDNIHIQTLATGGHSGPMTQIPSPGPGTHPMIHA